MSSANWEKLNEIFAEAIGLDPAAQKDFLQKIADENLRRETEAILAASRHAGEQMFLEADAFSAGAKILASGRVENFLPEKQIGKYRIVREIGRGGMGAVYLAERDDFRQQVALKIIKRGMDTDEIVKRFRRERQLLASLNHPFIARLLDGGTTERDLPFFVMEYVEGVPITEYCDREKLNIEKRLELFRKVCAAVAYAHQNLIVHRDLKPSNILVNRDSEPKLLDFGISKLLASNNAETTIEQTAAELRLMTPEYASPEQIKGEQITTISDIYSLGVLLYELLCGHRPLKLKNRPTGELIRIISEREPLAPSTAALTAGEVQQGETKEVLSPETIAETRAEKPERLRRRLAGDLDNIVLMSLRKEPSQRYSSVEQFSEDLRRHLEGLPVLARRATFSYKANKFVRRNRVAVAFAGFAILAVLLGFSVAIWQAVIARQEKIRAERRFDEVRSLAKTLVSDWHRGIPESLVSNHVRGRIADISTNYLDNLARDSEDPELLRELAQAYILVGHDYTHQSIQEEKARESLEKAAAILRRLIADEPSDVESRRLLAECLNQYDGYFGERDRAESLKNRLEIVRLNEEIVALQPEDSKAIFQLGVAYAVNGLVLKFVGRYEESVESYRKAVNIWERRVKHLEQMANTPEERASLVSTYVYLAGDRTNHLGEIEGAVENMRRAVEISDLLYNENPQNEKVVFAAGTAYYTYGIILKKSGDVRGSIEAFRKGLNYARFHLSDFEVNKGYFIRKEYDCLMEIAEALLESGDSRSALKALRESLNLRRIQTERDKGTFQAYLGHGVHFSSGGLLLTRMKRFDEAAEAFGEAERSYLKVLENNPKKIEVYRNLATLYFRMGDFFAGMGTCDFRRGQVYGGLLSNFYCPPQGDEMTSDRRRLQMAQKMYQKAVNILNELDLKSLAHQDEKENLRLGREKIEICTKKLGNKSS